MRVTFKHSAEAKECSGDFNIRHAVTIDSHTWEDDLDTVIQDIIVPGLISMGFLEQSIAEGFLQYGKDSLRAK